MALSANNKSMDDYSFTKRLQFNGTMDSALPPTYRAIKFAVTGPCKITVYGMSGSGNTVRKLKISDGTAILSDSFLENDGNALGKGEYNYTGGAGNIYIGSASSGYNIYAVGVTY
jgi:hypothetical protein